MAQSKGREEKKSVQSFVLLVGKSIFTLFKKKQYAILLYIVDYSPDPQFDRIPACPIALSVWCTSHSSRDIHCQIHPLPRPSSRFTIRAEKMHNGVVQSVVHTHPLLALLLIFVLHFHHVYTGRH